MSMRLRTVLVGVGILLLVVIWFLLLWQPRQNRISELREQQDTTRREIAGLETRLQRLKELQADAPRLQAELARLQDALPSDPRVPDFILQVQQSASLAGVDFLSVSPSLPSTFTPPAAAAPGQVPAAPSPGLQVIAVNVSTTGKFFALEDYIVRMERLQRAVRINTFALAPSGSDVPGASPTISVSFNMQMFMLSAAAAAAAPPDAAAAPANPQAAALAEPGARTPPRDRRGAT